MKAVKLLFFVCSVFLIVSSSTAHRYGSTKKTYIDCIYDSLNNYLLDTCSSSVFAKPRDTTVLRNVAIKVDETNAALKYKLALQCDKIILRGFSKLQIEGNTYSHGNIRGLEVRLNIPKIWSEGSCDVDMTFAGHRENSKEVIKTEHENIKAMVSVQLKPSKENGKTQWHLQSLSINPSKLFSNYIRRESNSNSVPQSGFNFGAFNGITDAINSKMEPILRNHFEKILVKAVKTKLTFPQ